MSLVASQPNAGWLEVHSFPIDVYITRPLVIKDYRAVAPDTHGIGVALNWDKLKPHEVLAGINSCKNESVLTKSARTHESSILYRK